MSSKQKYTPVRFSHLTSYSGVGAIVRDKDDLLVTVPDTRFWTDSHGNNSTELILYVDRVKKALEIDKELKMPPMAKELDNGKINGDYIPTVLFPTFFVCKKCKMLHQNLWSRTNIKTLENVICEHKPCSGVLEQVTWCAVSSNGYLDDVPWHYICHKGSDKQCKEDYYASYLKLRKNVDGKNQVSCTRCGAANNYANEITEVMNRSQPWIYGKEDGFKPGNIKILEVNESSVFSPVNEKAIVIPPESRIDKSSVVDRIYSNSTFRKKLDRARSDDQKRKKIIKQIITEYRSAEEEIEDALQQIADGYPPLNKISSTGLYKDEYEAFLTPIDNVQDGEDFVTEHKSFEWLGLREMLTGDLLSITKLISSLIVVKRLREIQVFKGFSRLHPPKENEQPVIVPPDITGESDWLPAIELFGEGIFFTIDEDLLTEWELVQSIRTRANEIEHRYENSELSFPFDLTVTPRFLLLHTLAHLLIRELEVVAGYPAASLKERIYHSKDDKMAGILIYTTAADIAGTLGGIIENAEPEAFLKLLSGVFKHAQWCSHDPVCTEHQGQGPGWLNRAACHACALLPETSCDFGNVFLDRVVIKGSNSLKIPGILNFVKEVHNE